jgi:hypothetical protein
LHTTMQGGPFGPTALVTGDDKVFGMASMFSILSALECGPSMGVFRTFDEALNWLLRPTIGRGTGLLLGEN